MPLYEYFCSDCHASFEALVPLSASEKSIPNCPICGERSRRILSRVNFATGTPDLPPQHRRDDKSDVTRLRLPSAARLCWMDDQSAARLAAYKAGRGAEYDDTAAARKERAAQRGEGDNSQPASSATSHSPLADPAIVANRRKAAQRQKVAESAAITADADPKQR